MYFKYDPQNGIPVEHPYRRTIVPIMMGDNVEAPMGFSVHMTEWEPGSQVDDHSHPDAAEAMYCISGRGIASIEDQQYEFVPGSMIAAAPGVRHCIKNTGDELLQALCIFSPPNTGEGLRSRAQATVDAWNLEQKKD